MSAQPADILQWFMAAFRQYTVFSGRARRMEYWSFSLVCLSIDLVLGIIDSFVGIPLLMPLFSLAVFLPGLAVTVRRLHDTGKAWYYILVALIPFGVFVLLYWLVRAGDVGPNEFGEDPKAYS